MFCIHLIPYMSSSWSIRLSHNILFVKNVIWHGTMCLQLWFLYWIGEEKDWSLGLQYNTIHRYVQHTVQILEDVTNGMWTCRHQRRHLHPIMYFKTCSWKKEQIFVWKLCTAAFRYSPTFHLSLWRLSRCANKGRSNQDWTTGMSSKVRRLKPQWLKTLE